jgi:hypothetical protein
VRLGRLEARLKTVTTGDLASLYAALNERDQSVNTTAPAIVFVSAPPDGPALDHAVLDHAALDHAVLDRCSHFGIAAVEITAAAPEPGAYLIGGALHGLRLPADEPDFSATVVAVAERARLRQWAAACQDPEFTTTHKPGSDSRGVVQFRLGDEEIVAKIGDAAGLAGEVAFATKVNALLAGDGRPRLFPRVHGLLTEGEQAVSLMEAGQPMPIAALFADEPRRTLASSAVTALTPHLEQLAAWYRLTAADRPPTVADYLYRERYHALRELPAFTATFRAFFGDVPVADVLDVPVELAGGLVVPGWGEAVAWLDKVAPDLLPGQGSAVHGDIYAANMLLLPDGTPVLIDPRTVWEGRDRPDVGYGDPVFDLATLLHGVFPMAAILHAVQSGDPAALFGGDPEAGQVRRGQDRLALSALTLPVGFPAAVTELEAAMLAALPPATEPAWRARTRLYIGAATSLAGWLKYERSLAAPQAWLATAGYVAWYLWQARNVWDNGNGKQAP